MHDVEVRIRSLVLSTHLIDVEKRLDCGIDIDGAESTIEGGVDLHGFLGLYPEVRTGFDYIKVKLKVKSDTSIEELESLAKYSPVFDIITNPTPVSIEFIK